MFKCSKAFNKFVKDVTAYLEKRMHIQVEFNKKLQQLAKSTIEALDPTVFLQAQTWNDVMQVRPSLSVIERNTPYDSLVRSFIDR